MLTHDECVALKAAGFPQRVLNGQTMHYYCETSSDDRRNFGKPDSEREPVWELLYGTHGWIRKVACPNTDELLADIGRRFFPGKPWTWLSGEFAGWRYREFACTNTPEADTQLEAIQQWYIALAQQEQP